MPIITLETGSPYFTFPKDLELLAKDLRARSPETTLVYDLRLFTCAVLDGARGATSGNGCGS